ncbi:MAG: hypothetical protein K2K24_01060, partial [Clostridia bacterium]|nr:hypothetical protein [Clostridia bacterium]
AKPVQGSKVKDYENNNANIDFEFLGVDSSKLDIECSGIDVNGDPLPKNTMTYNPIDGGGVVRLTASKVGKYTVKVTPKSGVCWPDKSSNAIEFTYYIKYKVAELGISGSNTAVYNGKEQSFALLNYDKDKMDVKADSVADLTFDDDGTPAVFKVTKAKTYNVNVELKNTTLMEWSSGGTGVKSVSVEITKKKVTKPTLSDNPPSKPYTGSPVNFPLSNYTAGGDVVLKDPSSATVSSITQTNAGTYVYTISLKDKNNTEWVGGGTADDTLTVYITSSGIAKPSLSNSAALLTQEKTYSTTTTPKGATFTIYNTAGVYITPTDTTQTDAVLSGNTITVTKVGTYTFTVSLADSTNTKWDDDTNGTYDLTVKVKPKEVVKPTLATTESSSKPYTGNSITFNLTGMSADVELKDPSSATVAGITQTNAGTYDYSATLVDPINTTWVGGGTTPVPLPVTIEKKGIVIPAFTQNADKKTYNGSEQTFSLSTLDASAIEIRNSDGDVVTAFTGKDARTYNYKLHLKDTANTQWKDTDGDITPKDISVTIDPATLDITSFTCSETTLSWEKGTSGVTFSVVENSLDNETVKLMLYIEKGGQKSYDFDSVDEIVAKTVTVTIPNRLDQGTYTIGVELADASLYPANGNYVLTNVQSKIRKTFRVTGLGLTLTEENMPWVYKYTDKDGMENIVNILAQEGETARNVKLTYTGNEYEFSID